MRKMVHAAAHGGGEDSGVETWNDGQLEQVIRFRGRSLAAAVPAVLWAGARMLKGGCGRGQYVVC
jgi:hypothetical protein